MPSPEIVEATVNCPKCGASVPLTEALAAPLLAATREEFHTKIREQEEATARQSAELAEKEAKLTQEQSNIKAREEELNRQQAEQRRLIAAEVARQTEEQLTERLVEEKKQIVADEKRRAERRFADQIAEKERSAKEDEARIIQLNEKLATAQQTEVQLRRREQEISDKERELDLRVEKEVGGRIDGVRAEAVEQERERTNLTVQDKDRKINELSRALEDLQRKVQQGSQQAQGETLELVLEEQLRRAFPFDELQPVPKGEYGGDTVQIVRDVSGRECGRILWEFKRTKNWDAKWLPKLRGDQRASHADLAVIVSQAMPPDVQHFSEIDGIWVSSLVCTLPVANALRSTLLQLAGQRRNQEGQQTKSELVYAYLTGSQFRGRIEAIAERWKEMAKDLGDEKRATLKRWAKRESQLHQLLESTSGIYGDLQGIAGRDVAEIQALEDPLLLES